jgi:hypothetical protein
MAETASPLAMFATNKLLLKRRPQRSWRCIVNNNRKSPQVKRFGLTIHPVATIELYGLYYNET